MPYSGTYPVQARLQNAAQRMHICQKSAQRGEQLPCSKPAAARAHRKQEGCRSRKYTEQQVKHRRGRRSESPPRRTEKVIHKSEQPATQMCKNYCSSLSADIQLHTIQPNSFDQKPPLGAGSS